MNKVAINMIIGQRVEQYLEFALKSTMWADEHVIVNTGSDDNPNMNTVRSLLPHAKIVKFEGVFDFASARNLALENTESQWIIWQDADEVHFEAFRDIVHKYLDQSIYDCIEFGFFHFLLDMFHFQSIDLRTNMFRREGKKWYGKVHEIISPINNKKHDEYRYHHYGYTKPQNEIYENWRLYWSLNKDENYKLDEYRNPDDIISDRVTVAHEYNAGYPEVIRDFVQQQKPKVENYHFKEYNE